MYVALVILAVLVIAIFSAIKIAREYERGVVFRLGRFLAVKGPGLYLLIPFVDKAVTVDLRTITLNVPPQEVITRDNVTVKVNAVAYFRVVEAEKAIVQVENYLVATSQIAQTTLRSVLGTVDLDHLLSEREQINERLQTIIDQQTAPWGIKVSVVEVKDVELPQTMQRALARQAEAERERRAKIIAAEGELQASEKLTQAAMVIAREPAALQLRYLQTMNEISSERTSTMIIPLPIDLFEPFIRRGRGGDRPMPPTGPMPGGFGQAAHGPDVPPAE
jgi:regulator of protease activity HflC (stomatin/prohibitin superfamily)